MKEEEKKAIENIEKWLNKEESYCTDEDIKIVLNLIKTQQLEIKKLRFHLQSEEQQREYDIKEIDKLKGECVKKNKQIELMAEQLTTPIHDKKWVIKYYTELAEGNKL